MAYEFGLVEGDIDCLDERRLKSAIPTGQSFSQFKDKIKQGHLVLLSDSPNVPLLIKDSSFGSKYWTLNNQVRHNFESTTQSDFLKRTKMSGSSSGGGYHSKSLFPPLPMDSYVPQPVRLAPSDTPPPLKYEYCFEIASCHESFHRNAACMFALTKTKNEASLGRWNESKTEHGTRYTLYSAYNELKKLIGQIANISLGISLKEPVTLRNIGTQVANEGFILVSPAVQLGGRLGFPTEGFYYHFHNNELIQEYRLLGDKNWFFYATKSMQHHLDPERGYNNDQTAILVYWKVGGKIVENQHLLYINRQITRDELDNINEDWLIKHGVKLDIPALLETKKQAVALRAASKEEQAQNKPKFHTVQIDEKTGERETWDKIAKQYGLTPLELLSLNPSYNKDPMSLMVGHLLNVEKAKPVEEKEPIYGFPPVQVTTINHPLNSYYDYSEYLINGSTVKAINSEQIVEKDIPVLSLKIYLLQSKQLAQSEKLESIAQGKKEVIKKGAKGDEVKFIQEALLKMKFNLGRADGDFGSGTESAIKTFQSTYTPTNEIHSDYKVGSADGVVGKNTLLALDEAVVVGWMKAVSPFEWHDPLDNMMLCLYSQGGHSKPNHGSFGETIRDGNKAHSGVDLFAPVDTDVYAVVDGVITRAYTSSSLAGNTLCLKALDRNNLLEHRNKDYIPIYKSYGEALEGKDFNEEKDFIFTYMHLSKFLVKAGDIVKKGDVIAKSGITGRRGADFDAANPHLHFALGNSSPSLYPTACNPMQWITPKYEISLTEDDKKLQEKLRNDYKKR